ncbi:MAG: hypothetical protein HC902_00965 [Calothrix sp. SM1_5_4]|nr:hypothetical protein [Calothrix sp. SM1_5_4]
MSKNKSDSFDGQEFDPVPAHPLANSELNPEQWVELFITSNSISYDYKTASIWQEGELLDSKFLLSKCDSPLTSMTFLTFDNF